MAQQRVMPKLGNNPNNNLNGLIRGKIPPNPPLLQHSQRQLLLHLLHLPNNPKVERVRLVNLVLLLLMEVVDVVLNHGVLLVEMLELFVEVPLVVPTLGVLH